MEQYIIDNEEVMFRLLKQLVLDNIPDEIALKVTSSYTDTGVYFDTQEIDSILEGCKLKYTISTEINLSPFKKRNKLKRKETYISFDISSIKTELSNYVNDRNNWIRNYDDRLELCDIELEDYTLNLDAKKRDQQVADIQEKLKDTYNNSVSNIMFYEEDYTSKDSAPEWHTDYGCYSKSKASLDLGITLTNPPNIKMSTMYIVVPLLQIMDDFLSNSRLINEINSIKNELSVLRDVKFVFYSILKNEEYKYGGSSFSALFSNFMDKLTVDFLEKYNDKINPELIKMAPLNLLHNIANAFYHKSPDPKMVRYDNTKKLSRCHIVYTVD
jgi:hypothetical protein